MFARDYTLRLLDTIPEAHWFTIPTDVTHVVGQIGLLRRELGLKPVR